MPDTAPDLIGSKSAEGILRISRATLTRWVASGKLPAAGKLEGDKGAFVFDRAVVERLAAAERQPAAPAPPAVA